MKKLHFQFPDFPFHSFVCLLCLFAIIGIGSFAIWCPPKGDIPDNALKLVWSFVFVIMIFQIRPIIRECKNIKITKGDATLEATARDNEPTPEDK